MSTVYIYNATGFLIGMSEGVPAPENSTTIAPAYVAGKTPQFVNGAWVDQSSLQVLTPMTFYLAFTPAERIAIKGSIDPAVMEFWATYQLAVQLDKPIDPNLVSVQSALAYLAQKPGDEPPGPGILATADRIAQIIAGTPQ